MLLALKIRTRELLFSFVYVGLKILHSPAGLIYLVMYHYRDLFRDMLDCFTLAMSFKLVCGFLRKHINELVLSILYISNGLIIIPSKV